MCVRVCVCHGHSVIIITRSQYTAQADARSSDDTTATETPQDVHNKDAAKGKQICSWFTAFVVEWTCNVSCEIFTTSWSCSVFVVVPKHPTAAHKHPHYQEHKDDRFTHVAPVLLPVSSLSLFIPFFFALLAAALFPNADSREHKRKATIYNHPHRNVPVQTTIM